MRRLLTATLLLTLTLAPTANAGIFSRVFGPRRQAAVCTGPQCRTQTLAPAVRYVAQPQPRYYVPAMAAPCPGGVCPAPTIQPRPQTQPAAIPATPKIVPIQPRPIVQPMPAAPAPSSPGIPRTVGYADPLAPVNAIRAQRGLPPLAWDDSLASYAASNNAACAARGQGHHVKPSYAAQNVAPTTDPTTAAAMWINSPPHAANMLGGYRFAGLSSGGGHTTMNLR